MCFLTELIKSPSKPNNNNMPETQCTFPYYWLCDCCMCFMGVWMSFLFLITRVVQRRALLAQLFQYTLASYQWHKIGHVRYISILTWLRGFQDELLYLELFSLLVIERQKKPSASVDNTLLDLQNSSYPTQPHSIISTRKNSGNTLRSSAYIVVRCSYVYKL